MTNENEDLSGEMASVWRIVAYDYTLTEHIAATVPWVHYELSAGTLFVEVEAEGYVAHVYATPMYDGAEGLPVGVLVDDAEVASWEMPVEWAGTLDLDREMWIRAMRHVIAEVLSVLARNGGRPPKEET